MISQQTPRNICEKNEQHGLVFADQFRSRNESKDEEMLEELGEKEQDETCDFNSETEQDMKKSDNKPLEETDE